jgi:hypothetical protein
VSNTGSVTYHRLDFVTRMITDKVMVGVSDGTYEALVTLNITINVVTQPVTETSGGSISWVYFLMLSILFMYRKHSEYTDIKINLPMSQCSINYIR